MLGENIAQTLQWQIPVTAYPKIEQGGIILKPSPAAAEFRSFLMDAAGRGILKQYGFSAAGE